MSDILEKFDILSKVGPKLKKEIKIFHVFDDEKGYNVLFITNDDKVFGFGANTYGCCGLGHNSVVNEPQVIPELCHKNIKQFFIGYEFVLGLSSNHKVYGWGRNDLCQLSRGYSSNITEYLRPEIILISNETIIQVSCGSNHSLVLTSSGNVYGWGYNKYGQIGCDIEQGQNISKPHEIKGFENVLIKSIYCLYCRSFALTSDGLVYSWGYNNFCQSGHDLPIREFLNSPRLVNISNVKDVCLSITNTYFLTNENDVYFCGLYYDENNCEKFQKQPKNLNNRKKFSSLHSVPYYQKSNQILAAVSEENIYELNKILMNKIKSKTIFDFYCKEYKMTYKTIDIKFDEENDYKIKVSEKLKEVFEKFNDFPVKDLKTIIEEKREYFRRQTNEAMNTIEYFISCQLFKELLECLQYLHESNPPIIVGNLRPDNILVFEEQTKGRFLKIDVQKSSYNTNEISSEDIYSLGVIAMDLFDFNIYVQVTKDINLKNQWSSLKTIINSMINSDIDKRPRCCDILSKMNEWFITLQELSECGATDSINETKDVNNFFQTYFNTRLINKIDSNIFESKDYLSKIDNKSDVYFIVNKERIPSIKLLLMIKNKVFRQLFNNCNDMRIIVNGLNPDAFKKMLQFIYWKKITFDDNIDNIQLFIDVYKCAERYKVKSLIETMKERIISIIDFNTIEAIIKFSKEFNLADLRSLTEMFLYNNIEKIITIDEDNVSRINNLSDNYVLKLILKYSANQKNKVDLLMNFMRPSGTDSVAIEKEKFTRVKNFSGESDPNLFGVKYSNLSTDLSEEKH